MEEGADLTVTSEPAKEGLGRKIVRPINSVEIASLLIPS